MATPTQDFNTLQLGTFLVDPTNPSECVVYVRKNEPNQAPVVFFDGGTTYYGRLEFHAGDGTIKGVIKSDSSAAIWLDMRSSTLGVVMSASGGVPIFIFGPDGVIRNASNAALLSNTTLGSGVVNSSLTSLGTLTALNCTGNVSIGTSGGGMFYNASTVRVGVRNSNPQYTFDCNGFINSTSYLVSSQVVLTNTTLGTGVVNSSLTSVGTLTSLTVNGNVSVKPASNLFTINATSELVGIGIAVPQHKLDVTGNINVSGDYKIGGSNVLTSTTLGSSVVNSSLTSVGTLTNLDVTGNISGTLTTAAQPNVTSLGALTNLVVSGSSGTMLTVSNSSGPFNNLGLATFFAPAQSTPNRRTIVYLGYDYGAQRNARLSFVNTNATLGTQCRFDIDFDNTAIAPFSLDHAGNLTIVGNLTAQRLLTGLTSTSVAIGDSAGGSGATKQLGSAVAIGNGAGRNNQQNAATAIGSGAGQENQEANASAFGRLAGQNNQGTLALALGFAAGQTNQHANSIILNAASVALNSDGTSRFYVKPIRNNTTQTSLLQYDATSGEITYGPTNIAGTLTTAVQPNITSVGTLGSLTVSGAASAGTLSLQSIANTSTSNVLYYDTTTKAVTYGASPTYAEGTLGADVTIAASTVATIFSVSLSSGTYVFTVMPRFFQQPNSGIEMRLEYGTTLIGGYNSLSGYPLANPLTFTFNLASSQTVSFKVGNISLSTLYVVATFGDYQTKWSYVKIG